MMVSGRCCTRQRISKVLKNSSKIVLLLSLSGFILLNLQQIPLASVRISDYQTQSFPSPQQPRIYLAREKYKEWINALFELAPPAPNCSDVESFISDYNETSPYWVHGTLVLQRNENVTGTDNATRTRTYHDAYEFVHFETRKPASGGRKGFFTRIWKDANQYRKLPPNLEMILYVNDKPRVNRAINKLPVFVIAGFFPAGSGLPNEWLGYVPFPSHFFDMSPNDTPPDRTEFSEKRPVVFFRGQFSEMGWNRYTNLMNIYQPPALSWRMQPNMLLIEMCSTLHLPALGQCLQRIKAIYARIFWRNLVLLWVTG